MGEIVASVELENTGDRCIVRRGLRPESELRRMTVLGVVDTGAVMLVLPENVVSRLGLRKQREVVVTYADQRKETRPVAGPVTVHIGNRFMITECIVGPPLSEPLIGQIVLTALDLVADSATRALGPRPESPDRPLIKLKRATLWRRGGAMAREVAASRRGGIAMRDDPVIAAVREVRHRISRSVGHDPYRLVEYYRQRQKRQADGADSCPPLRPEPKP